MSKTDDNVESPLKAEFEEYRDTLDRLKTTLESKTPDTADVAAHANALGNVCAALASLQNHDPANITLDNVVDVADVAQGAITSATEYLSGRR